MIEFPLTDDPITLADLIRLLRRRYRLLLASGLLGMAIAGVAAFVMDPVYRAVALVAPVKPDGSGDLAGLSGKLGGLASLAGISLSGDSGDRGIEAIATLRSRTLAEGLMRDKNLLPVLFADDWDPAKQQWKTPNPNKMPTLWDAYETFDKIRSITEDKKTGLVSIAIDWTDPKLASEWVSELIARTNQLLRTRDIERSKKNIAFLTRQLDQTGIIEVRQSIYKLMENEIRNVMLAQGNTEYAFKIVDPAVVPEKKIRPKRALIAVLGLVGGLLLASMLAILQGPLKLERT